MPIGARDRRIAAVLGLVTGLVGLTRADDHAFWVDEAFTATVTHRPLGAFVRTLGHEAGMVPYYVALWCWQLLGRSELWLRCLSVLGGALAIGALYLLAVHVAGRRTAVVAVAMMATNPAFLYQLTELRTYSWVIFLSSASTLQFLRLREAPDSRRSARAVGYGALVGLLVSNLVFAAAVPLTHVVFARPLVRSAEGRRSLRIAASVAIVLLLPALPALLTSNQLDWIRPLDAHRVRMQYQLSLGSTRWAVVVLIGVALLLLSLLRAMDRPDRGPTEAAPWLLVAATATGPGLLVLISLHHGVFISRYLAATLPLALLAAAIGYLRALDWLIGRSPGRLPTRQRWLTPTLVVVACAIGFDGNPFDDIPRPEDLRSPSRTIMASIDAATGADTAIVFDKALEGTAFEYYLPDQPWTEFRPGKPTPARPLDSFCRIWWVSRIPAAELAADTGQPIDDLLLLQFHGIALAELDTCATNTGGSAP